MGSQSCRQQQYALDLADKSRRRSAPRAHILIEVSTQTILDVGPYLTYRVRATPTLCESYSVLLRVSILRRKSTNRFSVCTFGSRSNLLLLARFCTKPCPNDQISQHRFIQITVTRQIFMFLYAIFVRIFRHNKVSDNVIYSRA